LKAKPLSPASLLATGRTVTVAGKKYEIEGSRGDERLIRIKLRGVDTREQAQALRGAYLQVPEKELVALPDGQYYRFQLVGLAVESTDGSELGRVTEVRSAPENDIYVVEGPYGEVLIPAVDDVVLEVDLSASRIVIEVVPGLLP
jgi:16S rRNA processing protein RimM